MEDDFGRDAEQFTGTRRIVKGSKVTLNHNFVITLNRSSYQDDLQSPEAVHLFYNKRRHALGIKAGTRDEPHVYIPHNSGSGASWTFGAKAFCNAFNIPAPPTSEQYQAKMEGEYLVVDLNQEPTVTGRPRTGRKTTQRGAQHGTATGGTNKSQHGPHDATSVVVGV